MLVALSGVQGSGKTTVLNGLKNLGYNIVERKTARSILADWGKTLEEVYNDRETSRKFQDELLARKQLDEEYALTSNELWFTERSFADVFTYALISLGHFNTYSNWLNQYFEDCKEANSKYLGVFFLNKPRNVQTENDGVRGINPHYVRQVNDIVRDASERMCIEEGGYRYGPQINPLIEVTYELVDMRVRFVAEQASSLWLTQRLNVDSVGGLTENHPLRIEADARAKQNSLPAASGYLVNGVSQTARVV